MDDKTKETRHDTFSTQKRKKFLEALRNSGNVRTSCKAANIGRATAYRTKAEDAQFAAQWQEALDDAVDLLESKAWSNALKKDSETSLWNLLKAHRGQMYREPVQRYAQTDPTGEEERGGYTDDELIAKAAAIIARRSQGVDGANL